MENLRSILERIIGLGFALFFWGGCAAFHATPVTTPVWVILALIVLARPAAWFIWRLVAIWHLIPLLWMAFYGALVWYEIRRQVTWSQDDLPTFGFMTISGFLLAVSTLLLIVQPIPQSQPTPQRTATDIVALIVTIAAGIITTYLALTLFYIR